MDSIAFYNRWVNGTGLRVRELIAGTAPSTAPADAIESCEEAAGAPLHLELETLKSCPVPLPSLQSEHLAPIRHVLLHGSMATGDACPFSDVDIAVIVEDARSYTSQQHQHAVLVLRKLLHASFGYDALMHHGLMFCAAPKFGAYDQSFLPIETLRRAVPLYGANTLVLRPVQAPQSTFVQSLSLAAASLRRALARGDFLHDDYRLKNLLSGSLLMPARILAARGVHLYKRDTFQAARQFFNAREWEFILRCEAHRVLWVRPPSPLLARHVPERCHPALRQVFMKRFAPRLNVRRFSKRMIAGFSASGNRFLDALERAS